MLENGIAGRSPTETYSDHGSRAVLHAMGSIHGEYETLLPYPVVDSPASPLELQAE